MRKFSTISAASALLLAGSAATAAPPASPAAPPAAAPVAAPAAPPAANPTSADVRCLIAMAVLGQDKQRQQLAQVGAIFYMGRLSARAPGLNVPAAVHAEELKLQGFSIQPELARCGPLVQSGIKSLQTSFAPPPGATPPAGATPAPKAAAPAPK
ncbi:MAG: hypothetical protein ACJ798_06265 [Phenylobacterium sp.]